MSVRRGEDWTPDDDETIRQMAATNASAVRIAARLKRTVSSVSRRAMAMCIPIRNVRDMRKAMRKAEEEATIR